MTRQGRFLRHVGTDPVKLHFLLSFIIRFIKAAQFVGFTCRNEFPCWRCQTVFSLLIKMSIYLAQTDALRYTASGMAGLQAKQVRWQGRFAWSSGPGYLNTAGVVRREMLS